MLTQPAAQPSRPAPLRKRRWLPLLIVLVIALHAWIQALLSRALDAWQIPQTFPKRLQATYVHTMALSAPRAAAAQAKPASAAPKRQGPSPAAEPVAPTPPASSPEPAASEAVAASVAPSAPDVAAVPDAAASAPPAANDREPPSVAQDGATNSVPPNFEWPQAVKLEYQLIGRYRGELKGSGVVEWVREGQHYQVHLDIAIGPRFAPMLSWHGSSDGQLRPEGLYPRRYDEQQGGLFSSRKHRQLIMDDDQVELNNGSRVPRIALLQDQTSQFIQMAYTFRMQPQLFMPGQVIEVPLARPGKIDTLYYDVIGEDQLDIPVGKVSALHLRPRRKEAAPGDFSVETWYSAQLEYLPVRIKLHQGEYDIDLVLSSLPAVAASEPPRAFRPK